MKTRGSVRIDTPKWARHSAAMTSARAQMPPGARLPVFPLACWALGLMAFIQLLIAGMALATRFEENRVVRVVEKEVVKPMIIRVPARGEPKEDAVVSRPPLPPPVAPAPLPDVAATPLSVPQIADPRSERMVDEAREARVAGDMGRAIVKLEEELFL